MKKLLALFMTVLLVAGVFAGCGNVGTKDDVSSAPAAPVTVRIGGLTGPTTMGLVKIIDDAEKGTAANKYEFKIAGSADEITPLLTKGELDMAAVPANLASVLYNKTEGKMTMLAINTLGVLYVVEKGETVKSVADLKGKTIYATGKGSTPEYNLRYILKENGIDPDKDVTIEFKSEPTEVVALLKQNADGIAMLPQPFVTVAGTNVEGLRVALNLNDEWNKLGNGSQMVTGVLVARKAFVEENPAAIEAFLKEYKASIAYTNENPEAAAPLIEKAGIVKAAVAQKAIPNCNLKFLGGEEMKTAAGGYLKVLFDQNPASVGGKLPEDGFYYAK